MQSREPMAVADEAVAARATPRLAHTRRTAKLSRRDRLGSTEGNEILTSAIAAVLTVLLVAEGITILSMRGLVSVHMFVGLLLIPPVLLKLASTGYRFVRCSSTRSASSSSASCSRSTSSPTSHA